MWCDTWKIRRIDTFEDWYEIDLSNIFLYTHPQKEQMCNQISHIDTC